MDFGWIHVINNGGGRKVRLFRRGNNFKRSVLILGNVLQLFVFVIIQYIVLVLSEV